MNKQIFVNLPVKDLQKSIAFFTKLGFTFNAQFTDETATCMIVAENIFVMLLTEPKFKSFIPTTTISDARKNTEVLIALSVKSRPKVDELMKIAVEAGGKTFKKPMDYGFMYGDAFHDLDGHIWELFYMDPSHVQK
jgi:predicted lactoylglutathione lyase